MLGTDRQYDASVILANPFIPLKFVRIFTINKTQIEEVCFVYPYMEAGWSTHQPSDLPKTFK